MAPTLQSVWDSIFQHHMEFCDRRFALTPDSGQPLAELADAIEALVQEAHHFMNEAQAQLVPWVQRPPSDVYGAFVLQVAQNTLDMLRGYLTEWSQQAQWYRDGFDRWRPDVATLSPEPVQPPFLPDVQGAKQGSRPSREEVLDQAYAFFQSRVDDLPKQIAFTRGRLERFRAEYQAGPLVDFQRAAANRQVIKTLEDTLQIQQESLKNALQVLRDRTTDQQTARAMAHLPNRRRELASGWHVIRAVLEGGGGDV